MHAWAGCSAQDHRGLMTVPSGDLSRDPQAGALEDAISDSKPDFSELQMPRPALPAAARCKRPLPVTSWHPRTSLIIRTRPRSLAGLQRGLQLPWHVYRHVYIHVQDVARGFASRMRALMQTLYTYI